MVAPLTCRLTRPLRAVGLDGLFRQALDRDGLAPAADLLDLVAQDRGRDDQRDRKDDGSNHAACLFQSSRAAALNTW